MKSMTSFVNVSYKINNYTLFFNVKTLNSKSFDLKIKLNQINFKIEKQIYDLLKKEINRGAIFFNLEISKDLESLVLDRFNKIKSISNTIDEKDYSLFLKVIDEKVLNDDPLKFSKKQLEAVFKKVINEVSCQRCKEGKKIYKTVLNNFNKMQKILKLLLKDNNLNTPKITNKLNKKLIRNNLNIENFDEYLNSLVIKQDIIEELDRLNFHLKDFNESLLASVGSIKLDFILQEIYREVNTILSKTDSIKIKQNALNLKLVANQLREQLSNVE